MSTSLFFKRNIDSLIAAVAGFVIIILFTRHGGIGISPDSVVYSTAAEHLKEYGRFTDFTQNSVVDFPLFYPLFLSTITLFTGFKPLMFGPYLNAFLFAFLIFLAGSMMEQFPHRSKWYKAAVLSSIVLSPGLLEDYSMLWSETLFIVLFLFFMIAMHRYFQTHSRRALIMAALITSVACVTRYVGVTTIITTGGILILADTTIAWRKKLTDLLLFGLISPLLFIINLIRNYFIRGTFTGHRERSLSPFIKNVHDTGTAFSDWLPFFHGNYKPATWVTLMILAALAFICIRQFLRKRRLADYPVMSSVFSLVYILFMIIIASISRFEELNSRFMSPAFIPLLWSCSYWLVPCSQLSKKSVKKWWVILGLLIFISFQYNQLSSDYETWDGVKDAGIPGYTEDDWRYSPTAQFIKADSLPFKMDYTIYSNAPDAVYFFTGRTTKYLPHRESKKQVQQFENDPHCYLVWLTQQPDADLVQLNFITRTKKMKLLKQFTDGAIYGSE
jgi:hypothetical protein